MKLEYIAKVQMTSNGLTFMQGAIHEFADEIGKKLLETFPMKFKLIEEPKPKVEAKVKPKTEE